MASTAHLHPLLDELHDTREVVLRRVASGDGLQAVWRDAADDARLAYCAWCAQPGLVAHAAYVAAADQADAALESLQTAAS